MNKVLLKSMYRRRMSCPHAVQQLWDAVKVIRCQHQVPTLEKIAKYMSKTHSVTEEEVSRQLQYCVRDGLLLVRKSKGSKGSKLGIEQEVYRLPETENDNNSESHDWYCFECHLGGDVIPCQGCHRVYHMACLTNTLGTKDKFICTVCQSCDEDSSLPNLKLSKLNVLLTMVCSVLKDRYSSLVHSSEFLRRSILIGSPGAQVDIGGPKESWRVRYLVYRPVDLGTMMSAAKSQKYPNVAAFLAHAQSIVHSVVIFHGVLSDLADKSRQMLRECLSEIAQIRACHSCYEAAFERQRHWFCKPCHPPHQLVFAGSPYMPAKVLQEKDNKLDVVYFGPGHPRGTVERDSTLPITTPVGHLGKTSPTWSKAMEELARHQKMLSFSNQSSDSDDSDVDDTISKEKISLVKENLPSVKSPVSLKRERYSSDEENVKKEEPKKEVVKKKRGRPPKNSLTSVSASSTPSTTPVSTEPKRKRGRPRQKKLEEEVEEKLPTNKQLTNEAANETLNGEEEIKTENPRPESPTTTAPTTTKKNEEEIVSSSCMEPQVRSFGTQTVKKEKANKEIIAKLKEELDEVRTAHAEELKALKEVHAQEIAATKKKQWCYNCEQEAIYHCCWNTAYCSTECQQVHWQREHKRVCRRKR